ncbi:MAG: tetraacyldisaccharide 4'-kinase [Lentisphaerae bacterium]|jgi:tetraacyldisaccharide 4'-kinase|nr:tetraacyldisaccharide 4'-kinase [Lentisphaerota bacterium]MBT4815109.1 tetraacyldisaccharide 4'-kinase [Lentisphaerota bacterium]MBT5611564.1 tetraacyldisaccharide 4'-kinase [Lentisphaerota bacterium]MBT7059591.1 tetraacyldisaccharide 4'-kinase [Lentisphaerota bacterium]MBT7844991.1 tetraacyldisaccharide 4'-kinase [Lentisphaerota bacterium]
MTSAEAIERLESYVVEIMAGRRRTLYDECFRGFLFCFSRLYRAVVQLRLTLYEQRVLRQHMLGCLVVSVGNLTCGGTGKTPVVEVFAKTLAANGRRVAILSRGYRSKAKPFLQRVQDFFLKTNKKIPPRVVSDGKRLLMDSAMSGDEPYMLASNLPDVMVVVDKDRVKAGRYAIRELGADTLVLDDGFQYLRLRPRLNILLVDSTRPFDNHYPLPRGLLREPIKNLRRADYVFLTKSSGGSHLRHLKGFIRSHNPRAEIIECTHRPQYLENVYTKERQPLEALRGRRLAAVSGIAVPESFESFLETLGGEVVYAERFMDHHRYRQQEIIDFVNASLNREAEIIVTTEKDSVRFPMLDRRDLPVLFLRVEIDILSGEESFNDCIARMCFV